MENGTSKTGACKTKAMGKCEAKKPNPQSLQQDTTSLLRRSPARQFRGANCVGSGGGGDEVGQEADWVGSGGDSRAGLEPTFLRY